MQLRKVKISCPGTTARSRGFVLLLVLTVTLMLSFAVYSFSTLMATSAAASRTGLQQLQRRQLAESAMAVAAEQIRRREPNPVSAPMELRLPDGTPVLLAVFPGIPANDSKPVFGLRNESAKLNLNTLPVQPSRRQQARRRLSVIPGMTPAIADSIMDWLDPDDEPTENGAEAAWYLNQSPPRLPGNGPFRELHELLQVRGISRDLLYGEDQNANGLLDPEENDGNRSLPPDNSDGLLQAGLSEYLTTLSAESIRTTEGSSIIWLNNPHLPQLYDQIQAKFGSEAALYLTAARLTGVTWLDDVRPDQGEDQEIRRLERLEQAAERLNAQLGLGNPGSTGSTSTSATRGGLRLDRKGVFRFRSHVDLFGGQVRVTIGGKDQLLESPWPSDASTMERMLPEFEQVFTLTPESVVEGRININLASEPVLASLPGLSESQARAIRVLQPDSRGLEQPGFGTVAWLVSRGVLNAGELRAIAPQITIGGGVVGGLAVGQIEGFPAAAAVQFQCDFTGRAPRIIWMRDLPVMAAEDLGLPGRNR
ncbi:MAG: putative type secretion system protein [Planctomycetota bacterium]